MSYDIRRGTITAGSYIIGVLIPVIIYYIYSILTRRAIRRRFERRQIVRDNQLSEIKNQVSRIKNKISRPKKRSAVLSKSVTDIIRMKTNQNVSWYNGNDLPQVPIFPLENKKKTTLWGSLFGAKKNESKI